MNKTLIAMTLALMTTTVLADSSHGHAAQGGMKMEHSTMGQGAMDQASMNHSEMDHSKMDHGNMMSMEGMSDVGMPAMGAKPDKVVHVILSDDMKITFKKAVTIEPDDVVQFVVMNTGKIDHEFSIGSATEQLAHRKMMREMTGGHMHDSGSTVTVQPGKAKQLLWHFHGDKQVEFACNIPGHAEAGMVKKLTLK
ncbi:cupredoxin family protein [Photobacterium sp. TY1-4]|uniref:copper-resistant cuproprotein CopI n=1 Tax=Photobacterium sp. TY1-4 TaxID=2899122 RepID=UPI0021BE9BE6|nr:copper-binding protein [Photobacterium sp. TY1-4]UXI04646.1 copper-binding protein [Photobacterium sp. TY1-4]